MCKLQLQSCLFLNNPRIHFFIYSIFVSSLMTMNTLYMNLRTRWCQHFFICGICHSNSKLKPRHEICTVCQLNNQPIDDSNSFETWNMLLYKFCCWLWFHRWQVASYLTWVRGRQNNISVHSCFLSQSAHKCTF